MKAAGEEAQKAFADAYNNIHGTTGMDFNAIYTLIQSKPDLFGAQGDQFMAQQILIHAKDFNFTDAQNLGLNVGRFQSGKFGFMLLGLPAAALAM